MTFQNQLMNALCWMKFGGGYTPRRSARGAPSSPALPNHVPSNTLQPYLTECIDKLVLESQLTHKIVNLLFTITNQNIE